MISKSFSLLIAISSATAPSFLIPQSRNQVSLGDTAIMQSNKDRPPNIQGEIQELIRRQSHKNFFFMI